MRTPVIQPIKTTADDYCQLRQGPLRMRFSADRDTTQRLNKVIKFEIDLNESPSRFRRLMRKLGRIVDGRNYP